MSIVVAEDLCHSYGRRRGIEHIDLRIETGEIFGFLGPNGAGKSTTMRILMGLLRPDAGTARICGKDCWNDGAALRHEVGYVAGDVRLYSWLSTRRALKFLSQIRGRDVLKSGLALAERFQLEPDLPVRKMSRGTRQKTGLVLALAHAPQLLVLDEPTSGLDPLMQDTLLACLREMVDQGHTVMFSSHTLGEVESLCDRIAIVRDGRIVENALLTDLQARAPRKIIVTLRPEQKISTIVWPAEVGLISVPAGQDRCQVEDLDLTVRSLSVSARRELTYRLELRGSSVPFLQWAASQKFADVMIGPPVLDEVFRSYYRDNAIPAPETNQ